MFQPEFEAVGVEGLEQILQTIMQLAQTDTIFASKEHYVLYTNKQRESLLKVDLNDKPLHVWYKNIQGYPILDHEREIIKKVLGDQISISDFYTKEKESIINETFSSVGRISARGNVQHAFHLLAQEKRINKNVVTPSSSTLFSKINNWASLFPPKIAPSAKSTETVAAKANEQGDVAKKIKR